jgi:integrase
MARPRNDKSGTIFYDKTKEKWKCSYYTIDTDTFKEVRKTKTFSSEQEAKDFYTALQFQKGNKIYAENNGIPLNLLLNSIIDKKIETGQISEIQYLRLKEVIKLIEKADAMHKNIDEITSDDIQMYLNSLREYSDSTIKKVMGMLQQGYRLAINKGYITKNPLYDVIRPKSLKQTKVIEALDLEEQQALTGYLLSMPIENEPYKNVFLLQMFMGLRVGEALALRSTDINLAKNIIYVNKTLTKDRNEKVIMGDSTKTYAGIREIPIPEFMRDSIVLQIKMAENNKDKQLFVNTSGGYVNPVNANRHLKEITKKMGMKPVTTHVLRHTYGTRCIEAGMRAVALQRLMGHKNVSVTLNTYTSIFNKYKEAELEKVNNYYMNNDIVNENQKFLNKNDDVKADNNIIEKRKRLQEIIKMLENDVIKGWLPISEYRENIEYLKKKYKFLDEEENGDDER